ncbi:hypothetical protein IGI04_036370 [Brassica rapa subsp. trilocularis]|uniref:Uncharacterized protein n=1 Tax=Brassica rapa subsp. trilocularis TaxID=1813537 RepID=A0ABQ7LE81_BRACM|nr:hypothetical protein IGI04_036370 [Brassica rapa subsp. trilocularis]
MDESDEGEPDLRREEPDLSREEPEPDLSREEPDLSREEPNELASLWSGPVTRSRLRAQEERLQEIAKTVGLGSRQGDQDKPASNHPWRQPIGSGRRPQFKGELAMIAEITRRMQNTYNRVQQANETLPGDNAGQERDAVAAGVQRARIGPIRGQRVELRGQPDLSREEPDLRREEPDLSREEPNELASLWSGPVTRSRLRAQEERLQEMAKTVGLGSRQGDQDKPASNHPWRQPTGSGRRS